MQKGAIIPLKWEKKITCSDPTEAEIKLVAPQQESPAFLYTAN